MPSNSAIRRRAWIHKWFSLVRTVFMLLPRGEPGIAPARHQVDNARTM